jgi:glycosyltransferase involved in cell wall biosynthesis
MLASQLPGKKGRLNPALLRHLSRSKPEIILFGGVWDSVTSILGVLTIKNSLKLGWYEANDLIPGKLGGLAGYLKRSLLDRLDWHAVPGQRAVRFLEMLYGAKTSGLQISFLPNIVDEARFSDQPLSEEEDKQMRQTLGVPQGRKLLFTTARLIPKKGIPQFIQAYAKADKADWHWLLLGSGPEKGAVIQAIKEAHLEEQVTLCEFVEYDKMPDIYRLADAYCLPSLNDPNPLSVVEALQSGLPVLLSKRLGNFPEAMQEGENGFAFEPGNVEETKRALEALFQTSEEERLRMGGASKAIGEAEWGSEAAIKRFLDPILKEINGKQ